MNGRFDTLQAAILIHKLAQTIKVIEAALW